MTQANETPIEPILLDTRGVSEALGVSQRQLKRMRAAGDFPRPVSIQSRKRYWRWDDLARWARELPTLAA